MVVLSGCMRTVDSSISTPSVGDSIHGFVTGGSPGESEEGEATRASMLASLMKEGAQTFKAIAPEELDVTKYTYPSGAFRQEVRNAAIQKFAASKGLKHIGYMDKYGRQKDYLLTPGQYFNWNAAMTYNRPYQDSTFADALDMYWQQKQSGNVDPKLRKQLMDEIYNMRLSEIEMRGGWERVKDEEPTLRLDYQLLDPLQFLGYEERPPEYYNALLYTNMPEHTKREMGAVSYSSPASWSP
jgi:hypothetical protein